jgi:ribose/xylose/arabinose/galactoside ABC-type transport system permease subunit
MSLGQTPGKETASGGRSSSLGLVAVRRPNRLLEAARDYGAVIGMLGVLAFFGAVQPKVLAPANLASIVDQTSSLVIMAVGMAIVMMMRGVDLSVAQVSDAAGLLAAMLLVHSFPWWTALVAPLALALLIGGINGAMMSYLGVPAIIGTLGMMFVVRSFELVLSRGREAQILFTLPPEQTGPFFFLGQGAVGPVSVSVILAAVVVFFGWMLTNATALGRYMAAVGGNVRAAFLAGVSHRVVFASGFMISALAAAVAGMLLTSRAALAAPGAFEPYLLDGFVAVYLGSLTNRRGTINVIGTALGALFVGLIGNALTLMGLGVPYRYMAYGVVILVAMTIGVMRRE